MIPGIDLAGVTGWFEANVAAVVPPLRVAQIAGGRSNLTYRVGDSAGSVFALRRPPLHGTPRPRHGPRAPGHLRPGRTPVPVLATVGLCQDPAVTGAPFYVMDYVDGIVPRDEATVAAGLDEPARGRPPARWSAPWSPSTRSTPERSALATSAATTATWSGSVRSVLLSQTRTWPLLRLDEVHRRLAANLPAQAGLARIVHGDFRLDNVVLSPAGQVLAVLDWGACAPATRWPTSGCSRCARG